MAVGRITGPLLKANLLRDGVNLAFETDLLYLDVINGKVGIKTTPTALDDYELGINGTTRTTDLEVTDQADIATFTIVDNTISSTNSTINIEPSGVNPVVYQGKIVTGDLQVSTNVIEVTALDTDLEINTLGTGKVNVNSDVVINGDLHVTGTVTADGDIAGQITIGDSNEDNVVFNADVNSNIIPNVTNTYDLGSDPSATPTPGKAWRNIYATTVVSTTLEIEELTVTGTVEATGDARFNGDVTFGDTSADTVTFAGTINSNLIPTTTAFYDLGTDLLRWADGYFSRVDIDNLVIDSNTISTTSGNDDLILSADGTGVISVPSNDVQIDQALTVTGATTLNATEITGDITHTGNITQTGDFTQIGDTDITGNLTVSSYAQFEQIRIDLNKISTSATDTNLLLEANGTGTIYVPSNDVQINQNLTVNGVVSVGDLDVTNTLTAGSFSTGDILIDDNYITTQLTNSNLELKANGTGTILVPSNDVEFSQDLTVGQDLTVTTGTTYLQAVDVTGDITQTGDIHQTGNFNTSGTAEITGNISATGYLQVDDIKLSGHTIESTAVDTDLELLPNGTGDVVFEDIRVTDNTFKSVGTNQNIVLQPNGTGSVVINSTQSLIIPVGSSADRPASPVNGMIRYNTDLDRYEGWNSTYSQWLQLSGVQDLDGNTYIKAEATVGSNDNILYFYADGNLTTTIDSTKLFTERFQTTGIDIDGNSISAINTNADINLTTSGTGAVKIGNLNIRNNTITNTVSGAVTDFSETGSGYVKISGTNGVVIPVGDLTNLPAVTEVGMTRFNTYYGYVEVWNGTTWSNIAGASSGVTLSQAQDIGIVSALLFG